MDRYQILLSEDALLRIADYKKHIENNKQAAGGRLLQQLGADPLSLQQFIQTLLSTKFPIIFAENIDCDGSYWNSIEVALLGNINVGMKVKIYDNGMWSTSSKLFQQYAVPLDGYLLFTPGALLARSTAAPSPDFLEVVSPETNQINPEKYNGLVERRLLPLLAYANQISKENEKMAFITVPGIGCGMFAGSFAGQMGEHLNQSLQSMLRKHAEVLTNIVCVRYATLTGCTNEEQHTIGDIIYRGRPMFNIPKPTQLVDPVAMQEHGDDFSNCILFKVVAWDHVSYPGNDFFAGSRSTDDGVSAAATNSMQVLTGIQGEYRNGKYMPPKEYSNWQDVVFKNNIKLIADNNNIIITNPSGYNTKLQ